jgi:dTDP-4-dehydrorhamnose 3,5-epimerase
VTSPGVGLRVEPLGLRGLCLLHGVRHHDDRGYLRKVLVVTHARSLGIEVVVDEVVQTANHEAGTVRGLHYQVAPLEETKTLWVSQGAIFDVLVDLRPEEPTFGSWVAVRLSGDDDTALHVPPGLAHGYQTLDDDTTLTYLMGGAFSPDHARTLRWDDPTVGIAWPLPVARISEKDRQGHAWPPQ